MWFPFKNINLIWPLIVARSNFSSVAWTENIWCVFRVKAPFPNSANVDLVRLVRTELNTSFTFISLHSMHPSAGFEWQINYRPIAILNSSFVKCLENVFNFIFDLYQGDFYKVLTEVVRCSFYGLKIVPWCSAQSIPFVILTKVLKHSAPWLSKEELEKRNIWLERDCIGLFNYPNQSSIKESAS